MTYNGCSRTLSLTQLSSEAQPGNRFAGAKHFPFTYSLSLPFFLSLLIPGRSLLSTISLSTPFPSPVPCPSHSLTTKRFLMLSEPDLSVSDVLSKACVDG